MTMVWLLNCYGRTENTEFPPLPTGNQSKMKNLLKAVCAVLMTLSVATVFAAESDSNKRYQAVYVSKVAVEADMDRNSPDEVEYYADLETEATTKVAKWFKDEGYAIAETPESDNDRLLIINTKVLFNAGNRALRWVGGIGGAGKATADVTMDAIESKSGKVIASKNAKDSLRMGGFGGSAPGMLMGAIDSAWNYVITDLNEMK